MKANELRIGNYVWDDYSGEMIVYAILNSYEGKEMVNLKKQEGLPEGRYLLETLHRIPLTEEWLLKFGFRSNNGYPLKLLCGYIKIRNGVWFFKYNKLDIELQYVHQLQNLYFALTGKELEII
jgi:hypothetical protein